jgi:nickel-dependent lactate racemase
MKDRGREAEEEAMARRPVTLTYGKGTKRLEVDESFLAGEPVAPRKVEVPKRDPHDVISEALAAPVGRPLLRSLVKGKKVCLIVSDDFRAGLQVEIGECLLEEIAAGGPARVWIVSATGSHDPEVYARRILTALEAKAKALRLPFELVWHDCDRSRFVEAGTTGLGTRLLVESVYLEADVRVYGHEAKHHYMAGYSTVDKQVIPGVSMRKTIEMNHKLSLDEDSRAGNISYHPDPARQRNLFSADARDGRKIMEGRRLAADGTVVDGKTESFAVDMISEKQDILWIAAGDPDQVTAMMPAEADRFGAFEVERQRYVLISPGGPPACDALYGTQNCFDMALLGAIVENGEALIVAPCGGRDDLPPDVRGLAPDAKSKELFYDNLVCLQCQPLEECEAHIRDHFELYLWKTIRVLRLTKKYGLTLYLTSELDDEAVRRAGLLPEHDPQRWIDERARRGDGKLWVIDGGNKLFVSGTDPKPGPGKETPYCTDRG